MAPPRLLLSLWSCSGLALLLLAGGGGLREAAARTVPVEFLYPPYNLTYMHYIDTSGVFLRSPNATFSAAVFNAGSDSPSSSGSADESMMMSRYFFSVLHDRSRTPVWAATAGSTIIQSIILSLNASGLYISDPADQSAPSWSTPRLAAPVAALRLLDTGQLALIDGSNATLWSTFDAPTDTLLQGQVLPVGVPLTATASDQDLSPGAYRLLLTPTDALLQWASSSDGRGDFVTYWALSSDPASVQDSNRAVRSMKVNASGIYLLTDDDGRETVFSLRFASPPAPATGMLLKVDSSGRLRALSTTYSPTAARATLPAVWAAPASDCDLPLPCGSLGLCTPGNNGSSCMCPDAFTTHTSGGCSPADGSALPVLSDSCVAANNASSKPSSSATAYSYTRLGDGIGYFASKFALPTTAGDALSACRDLCSANCSCVGFIYRNSSKSCLLMHNQIGSVFRGGGNSAAATVAFVKTVSPAPSRGQGGGGGGSSSSLSTITIIFGIVLPAVAAVFITFLLYVLGVHWLKNRHGGASTGKAKKKQHGHGGSSWFMLHMMPSLSSSRASSNVPSEKGDGDGDSEDEDDEVLIPGLPTRFTFADLEMATNGFKWQIGSGGFGSVYRGELPDRTTVAVKRMNNLGMQGRREFLTEIAVIGNVHHVNLVKLRGFCAEGARQQLLVYEYMSRGSLDQSLFPRAAAAAKKRAVLEWPERLGVCVGAARGLAYLHAGCDRKILHCDVKPENILLDERGGVKIADFGLAKLMSPEQSGLFTTMRGTRGYLAPEWLMNAPITDKADVYSFGMVLLEIVRGRKNSKQDDEHDTATTGTGSTGTSSAAASSDGGAGGEATKARSSYFPALALELHEEGRYLELVDPRLEGRAEAAEVARVVRVALCCLQEEASTRPAMTVVSGMLDGSMDVCVPRTEQLAYLRMYGRGLVDVRPGGWKGKWKGSEMTAGSSSWSPPSCVSAQQLSAPR